MKVTLLGVDLAKTIFQVCGVNKAGRPVFNRQVRRSRLMALLTQYPDATVAMEACSGSNYWARTLQSQGIEVKLIPPQHVKPFVKGNKNDRNDAFAITEAARRPQLLTVKPRTIAQTELIQVHRLRARRVSEKTTLSNQLRGFLNEYGVVLGRGRAALHTALPDLLSDSNSALSPSAKELMSLIWDEWRSLEDAIAHLDKMIAHQAKVDEAAQRLMKVQGIGEKIATASIGHIGRGEAYKNGRHFAANLGLVPKERSSGGKQTLGGITKRGNRYLRHLLIQGAWSVIRYADRHDDRLSRWAREIVARRGKQKAAVAVAHKLARIVWSMLYHQTEYRPA